jgi:hypothetical protein
VEGTEEDFEDIPPTQASEDYAPPFKAHTLKRAHRKISFSIVTSTPSTAKRCKTQPVPESPFTPLSNTTPLGIESLVALKARLQTRAITNARVLSKSATGVKYTPGTPEWTKLEMELVSHPPAAPRLSVCLGVDEEGMEILQDYSTQVDK